MVNILGSVQLRSMLVWLIAYAETLADRLGRPPNVATGDDDALMVNAKSL